jgi:hypothetical protein
LPYQVNESSFQVLAFQGEAYSSWDGLLEACRASFEGACVFELEAYLDFSFFYLAYVAILRSQADHIRLDCLHE